MSSKFHTVLHVEDDPNDVLLVQRAIRKAKLALQLTCVSDGELALAYLAGEEIYGDRERFPIPSLILLDLKIPRRSGLEVLQWLRSHPGLKRIPVAVLTSSRHERDIDAAYEAGANSYLVKPVGFDALLGLVELLHTYWFVLNQQPSLSI